MPLPERVEGEGLVLRRWEVADAEALGLAIAESLGVLLPWMPWAVFEPVPVEKRRQIIGEWESDWRDGGDVYLGVFSEGRIAGSTGLHRRRGPHALEIGYWTHSAFQRRGVATAVTRLLTDTALALPGIERVEIHTDQANDASAAIPRRLGYTLAAETPKEPVAPGEAGIDLAWHMTATDWPATRT